MIYLVVKQFNYNGVDYKTGDEWEPGGFKNDAKLIEHQFVTEKMEKQKTGFICNDCEREFKSKSGLMSHRRAKHE